jgi:hypothetical protein
MLVRYGSLEDLQCGDANGFTRALTAGACRQMIVPEFDDQSEWLSVYAYLPFMLPAPPGSGAGPRSFRFELRVILVFGRAAQRPGHE